MILSSPVWVLAALPALFAMGTPLVGGYVATMGKVAPRWRILGGLTVSAYLVLLSAIHESWDESNASDLILIFMAYANFATAGLALVVATVVGVLHWAITYEKP